MYEGTPYFDVGTIRAVEAVSFALPSRWLEKLGQTISLLAVSVRVVWPAGALGSCSFMILLLRTEVLACTPYFVPFRVQSMKNLAVLSPH
jgi:hypothetical protein